MSLLANIIGFSAFGFGARCFQLGIQKRNIFAHPEGHLVAAGLFGVLGYFLYDTEQRQNEQIAHKRKILEAHRAREAASA